MYRNETAPIVIFVYNRPRHTVKMLDSLLTNNELHKSLVTVYSDGPKNDEDKKNIEEVRRIVKEKLPQAVIKNKEHNSGLAQSIIHGVTEQLQTHDRVIVIEDDLVFSKYFLRYMNNALDYYKNESRVMHVSAYVLPVHQILPSTFFYREPNSWAWGTWRSAWDYFEKDSRKLAIEIYKKKRINDFNQNYAGQYWEMLCKQHLGEIDSWAIRWYATLFKNKGLALYPGESLVHNIGFDGSGQHSPANHKYDVVLSNTMPIFSNDIRENGSYFRAIKKFKINSPVHSLSRRIKHYLMRNQYLTAITAD